MAQPSACYSLAHGDICGACMHGALDAWANDFQPTAFSIPCEEAAALSDFCFKPSEQTWDGTPPPALLGLFATARNRATRHQGTNQYV